MKHHTSYWLLKSEADCYSIDDLQKDGKTSWTGVRNYQARNFIRDAMKKGDKALFYHSNADPNSIVGICEIMSNAYPDQTAFNSSDEHYDAASTKDNPRWFAVDVAFVKKLKHPVTLQNVKNSPLLKGMMVTQKGNRLSVQPVSEAHFKAIQEMGK